MDISDITASNLQDEIIASINVEEYREQVTKRMEDGGYMNILLGYPRSVFQDFEGSLRTKIDLVEADIRLVLEKNISSFNTYELDPGIYNFKDFSEALFNILEHDYPSSNSEIVIEYDDITMKTKFVFKIWHHRYTIRWKIVFNTVLGLNHGWDFKHYNEYTSQKIVNLSSTKKST